MAPAAASGSPDKAPGQPASSGPADPADKQPAPVQSQEDTDAAWGEQSEPGDDERFYRDQPPHWQSG